MDFLFAEEEVDFVDDESDNVEKQETDINDHDGHRLRLRRQINRDGFDGVTQRDLLELMLCSVQPRQDVNIVCDELMEYFGDLRRLLKKNRYDVIWTNEPVMGVVTRLAANKYRRSGTKVVYMCHGFHFYKGASLPNWLIFYPIERILSRFCDVIVTMNQEDYA